MPRCIESGLGWNTKHNFVVQVSVTLRAIIGLTMGKPVMI